MTCPNDDITYTVYCTLTISYDQKQITTMFVTLVFNDGLKDDFFRRRTNTTTPTTNTHRLAAATPPATPVGSYQPTPSPPL